MSALPYQVPTKTWALGRVAQVLAAGAYERVRGAPAAGRSDVPRSPWDVSAEWLAAVLCRGQGAARVVSVTRGSVREGTTTRGTLKLTYNDAGRAASLPTRLFVKCTTGLAQRIMLGLGGLIGPNCRIYRTLIQGPR